MTISFLLFFHPQILGVKEWNQWGNSSIPEDNPYIDDKELQPEIRALGFRNHWRCSFDSERPSYFLCGDSGKVLYEEVDILTKGGNYGWPIYEGPFLHNHTVTRRKHVTQCWYRCCLHQRWVLLSIHDRPLLLWKVFVHGCIRADHLGRH